MNHVTRNFLGLIAGATLFTTAFAGAANAVPLTLINGWTNSAFGASKASVSIVNGIVHFKGAIATGGTNPDPFVMPEGYAPDTDVYVAVDLCNATNGRLHITPAGLVDVEAATFSDAQCFTSLDGASFALSTATYKPLNLKHGWFGSSFATRNPAVRLISGIVHFEGAMSTSGTNAFPFVLPANFRPATDVYAQVDLCNAANGRIHITPSGIVDVQTQGAFSTAQCFTSLEGASFALNGVGATALTLINGWTNAPFSTSNAAVRIVKGVVQFQGAIGTSGTNATPFVLPAGFRPPKTAWIPVDLCNANNGRLVISTNGVVTVQAEGGTFSNAQCFTSLEGASFHL